MLHRRKFLEILVYIHYHSSHASSSSSSSSISITSTTGGGENPTVMKRLNLLEENIYITKKILRYLIALVPIVSTPLLILSILAFTTHYIPYSYLINLIHSLFFLFFFFQFLLIVVFDFFFQLIIQLNY